MSLSIRIAQPDDIAAIRPLVESAYRGDSARGGWTHEADLLDDTRTDAEALGGIITDPAQRLLLAERDGALIGCVQIADRGDGLGYLGMLCVNPLLQAGGVGRLLIAAAEDHAARLFGANRMEMTVIDQRAELIAWYERRGYDHSGEKRDFPVPVQPPLYMVVLTRAL